MDLAKLPVFLENQQKGNYTVHLDLAGGGSDAAIQVNQSWQGDPEIMKWLRNRDFRHAMSLGIDRDQLNEVFWLGLGTPGSTRRRPRSTTYSPGPEWRTKWHTFDPKQANDLLDKAGLTQKDSEGMRLRSDGKGRLRFELVDDLRHLHAVCADRGDDRPAAQEDRRRRSTSSSWSAIWARTSAPTATIPSSIMVDESGLRDAVHLPEPGGSGRVRRADEPGHLRTGTTAAATRVSTRASTRKWSRCSTCSPKGQNELDAAKRIEIGKEIWKIVTEETYTHRPGRPLAGEQGIRIVKNNVGNVPARQSLGQHVRTPGTPTRQRCSSRRKAQAESFEFRVDGDS